jgi:hypothetical protein
MSRREQDVSGLEWPYQDPLRFAAEVRRPADPLNAVALLQGALHVALYEFLSGEDRSGLAHLIYPWWDYGVASWSGRLARAVDVLSACRLDVGGLAPLLAHRSRWSPQEQAVVLAEGYRTLGSLIPHGAQPIPIKAALPFPAHAERGQEFEPVRRLRASLRSLEPMLRGAYVHGSVATGDGVPGSSDLDTLVILRADTVTDPRQLLFARRELYLATRHLYQVDLLQHHGHFVLTDHDLGFYPQTFFPLVLFDHAMSLLGDSAIEVVERGAFWERAHDFWRTCQGLMMAARSPRRRYDAYRLKYLHQVAMLLPNLYLQLDGAYCYKREAFARCRQQFPVEWWVVLDGLSKERLAPRPRPWQPNLQRWCPPLNPRYAWAVNRVLMWPTTRRGTPWLQEIGKLASELLAARKDDLDAVAKRTDW